MSSASPACYGRMFPDLAQLEYNRPLRGRAFTVEARSLGIGVQGLDVKVEPAAWQACVACPEYRTCYDLSLAKLALYRALRALA
jgi:hypothetical protein